MMASGSCSTALAQVAPPAETPLPPQAAKVIDRLGTLDRLASGAWKMHRADLPHGESPGLDDSGWDTAKPGTEYPAEGIWFRRWIEVPKTLTGYDLSGTRIWFSLQARPADRGSLNEIVYFNGRRVALGESLEQLVLLESARPGDRVLVAVKVIPTADKIRFDGSTERIDFAPGRPDPQEMHDDFAILERLVPSLSAHVSDDQATLVKAIEQVDLAALDAGDQSRFDASLKSSHATVSSLLPMLQKAQVTLVGNAHIDAAWLWPRSETIDVVKRTFSTSLQLMQEYPGYHYTQSAADYNEWMADKYPEMTSEIARRIKEGRWEVVGGMWIEPDLNIPDGESTARSILLGKRWFQQHYGVDVHVGWNPDSFGYNWQLPQIYKRSGIDYFVTQKMSWNDTNKLPFKLFWWESPDGSKVLTYFPHGYANRIANPTRLARDLAQARIEAPGMTNMMDLYGVGDHGGGPTRDMLDELTRWMKPGKLTPKLEFGTAAGYFEAIAPQVAPQSNTWNYRSLAAGYQYPAEPPAGQISIPTWKDELYLEYHRGVYTTQAAMKRNLREAPVWTLNAEKYASLAWLDGDAYPTSELNDAWKKITFNGFHDLAAGSGIAVIYRDAQKDFDQVRWSTNEISAKALHTLAARVNTAAAQGVPVIVFNPLAWKRSGSITVNVQMPQATDSVSMLDARGNVLVSQVLSREEKSHTFHLLVKAHDLPALGYSVLYAVPGKRAVTSDLKAEGSTLENDALRVVVDLKTGCITSLYDKRAKAESIAAGMCGNQLQAFRDTPTRYDAWNIDPGTLDQPPTLISAVDSVKLVEAGPLRAAIRVTRHWQSSTFVQEIRLDEGSDEAVVSNDIDWHETHVLLKAAFPLAATAPFATYEIPYGSIERPTTRNNSWEKAQFEVPAQYWADLGDGHHGVSLINDSKFGYDAAGNTLRLTLLRSPASPDPDADRGPQHFTFALYPHAGDWKQALTVRHGYEFNDAPTALQAESHIGEMPVEHSFAEASAPNVVLTAMKKAEDSHAIILHLYEWAGKETQLSLRIPAGATTASETNLLEQVQGARVSLDGDKLNVVIHPYEILTLCVDYPERAK